MHYMNRAHTSPGLRAPPELPWTHLAVVVHCPRRLVRDALVAWLNRAAFRVVGQVADLAALPHLCGLRRPDVVIVDAGSDVGVTVRPLAELRARFRRTRIVVIYDEVPPATLADAQRSGLDTLVPSSMDLESLLVLLRRQGAGTGSEPAGRSAEQELTGREREVLALLGAGHSVRQIATLLNTGLSAIESCKRRIYAKLQVASKSQAVARAVGLGLIDTVQPATPSPAAVAGPPELTAREFDILRSIAMGHTVRQTARLLSIAEKTVENLQARLFLKLGTHSRAGAIRAAYVLGLLDPAFEGPPYADPVVAGPRRGV